MISNAVSVKCHANIQKVFDLLTKDVDFSKTQTCALYTLGQPKYIKLFKEKYPWVDFTIIETEELKCLYCDLPYKVIYVNIKEGEYWPKDMKFDKIIMNPPYDNGLHLKILNEVINHSDNILNLSPIRWLMDPVAKYKKGSEFIKYEKRILSHLKSLYKIDAKDACILFDIGQFSSLGIYNIDKNNVYTEYLKLNKPNDKTLFFDKVITRALTNKILSVKDKINDREEVKEFHVNLTRLHGHPGKKDFYDIATKRKDLVRNNPSLSQFFINFNSEKEAENFRMTLYSTFYKYITYLYKLDQNINYGCYPWMGEEVNPRTRLKGYESEWTDEDFYRFFNITEEEQKVIEDMMKKYV